MTRAEVRSFVESGINALTQMVQFNSGRITEFNSEADKVFPYGWLESLSVQTDTFVNAAPLDHWNIVLHVAKLDKMDSIPAQYEPIIDECDAIAQQLMMNYNQVVSGFQNITIEGAGRDPFIHKHADCTSGVILSFTLTGPDKSQLC